MLKLITFSLFLFIFFYSNVFAATYKYLCKGNGNSIVLQFDEIKKLVITNNQKPHKYKLKMELHIGIL